MVTADWSAARCGLKPIPIESVATYSTWPDGSVGSGGTELVCCTGGGGSATHAVTSMRHAATSPKHLSAVSALVSNRDCPAASPVIKSPSSILRPMSAHTASQLTLWLRALVFDRSRARVFESRLTLRTRTTSGVTSTHSSSVQNSIAASSSSLMGLARVSITSAED